MKPSVKISLIKKNKLSERNDSYETYYNEEMIFRPKVVEFEIKYDNNAEVVRK